MIEKGLASVVFIDSQQFHAMDVNMFVMIVLLLGLLIVMSITCLCTLACAVWLSKIHTIQKQSSAVSIRRGRANTNP